MKRFSGAICLLFVASMIASPLLISVEATVAPAQISPTFSGELIPDPYFAEEPYVEIGYSSPEFGYEYTPGSVTLVWAHTAGYSPTYGDGIPFTHCNEYALVLQEFILDYNETFQAVRIAASIEVDCTGDFADSDVIDDMWKVKIGIQPPSLSDPWTIRTLYDLKNGDIQDLEYIFPRVDVETIFADGASIDPYQLSIQLIPTFEFGSSNGGFAPSQEYDGSVKLTINHMSFEVMLENITSLAPPIRSPIYNTTDDANDTSLLMGVEAAGHDTICEFRKTTRPGPIWKYDLHILSSNHQLLRNISLNKFDPTLDLVQSFRYAVSDERIAVTNRYDNGTGIGIIIHFFDLDGNYLFNSTANLFELDEPIFLEFDSSGNLLLLVRSLRDSTPSSQYDWEHAYSILKLDTQGNRMWTQTVQVIPYRNDAYPSGLETIGNSTFIGLGDTIRRYDSNGSLVWSRNCTSYEICADPQGGVYSFSRKHSSALELTKWNPNGNIEWTISLGWNIESRWMEYPWLNCMSVGPTGYLHLVLVYNRIHACAVLTRITDTGQLLSQDTIAETEMIRDRNDVIFIIRNIAITGDGLVHLAGGNQYEIPYFLITYELPGNAPTTTNPNTSPPPIPFLIATMGISTILIVGVASSYFFLRRRRTLESLA